MYETESRLQGDDMCKRVKSDELGCVLVSSRAEQVEPGTNKSIGAAAGRRSLTL
jgi:hypothetical protein